MDLLIGRRFGKSFVQIFAGDDASGGKVGKQGDPGPKGQKRQQGQGLSGVS